MGNRNSRSADCAMRPDPLPPMSSYRDIGRPQSRDDAIGDSPLGDYVMRPDPPTPMSSDRGIGRPQSWDDAIGDSPLFDYTRPGHSPPRLISSLVRGRTQSRDDAIGDSPLGETSQKYEKSQTSQETETSQTSKKSEKSQTSQETEKSQTSKKSETPQTSQETEKSQTSKKSEKSQKSKKSETSLTRKKSETSQTSQESATSQTSQESETAQTSQESETAQTSQESETAQTSQESETAQTSQESETAQTSQESETAQTSQEYETSQTRIKSEMSQTPEKSKTSLTKKSEKKRLTSGCSCDKFHESVEEITPSMIGSTYRLSVTSPGLFRCSESGIQFQVTKPVIIEYEVDSWSNYTEILQNLPDEYEIIGPLFNIKCNIEPDVVSAVYLPHCLCLAGFKIHKSMMKCFHYKDDNMILETPSRIDAMYAVLENPTFSCIGIILYPLKFFKEEIIKLIPYHGMVLLFCNTIIREDRKYKYILHLYLLPRIHTVEKEVERFETRFSFQRINKPPQTESLYSNKKYRINGPFLAHVNPKTLLFETFCPSGVYSFTEICFQGKRNAEFNLSIHPENKKATVWESVVCAEEMQNLPFTPPRSPISLGDSTLFPEQSVHFVDKHRADLIRMISVVNMVLDDLLDLHLITYEQYNNVISESTKAEQMRALYDYIRAWGDDDKDKVYRSLRKHNYNVIKKLNKEVPEDHNEWDNTSKCQFL